MSTPVTHDAAEWKTIDELLAGIQPEHEPGVEALHELITANMAGAWTSPASIRRPITIDLRPHELAAYRAACARTRHADRLRVGLG